MGWYYVQWGHGRNRDKLSNETGEDRLDPSFNHLTHPRLVTAETLVMMRHGETSENAEL